MFPAHPPAHLHPTHRPNLIQEKLHCTAANTRTQLPGAPYLAHCYLAESCPPAHKRLRPPTALLHTSISPSDGTGNSLRSIPAPDSPATFSIFPTPASSPVRR